MTANEFKKRYLAYHKRLYRVAYVMTSNPHDAEDLLQDLYMKMWQIRDKLPDVVNPEAFMATVMKRLYFDKARRGDVSAGAVSISDIQEMPSEIDVALHYEQQEECAALQAFISHLPPKEQKIISMCVLEDKDYKEIGGDTGLSQSSIRALVMRAKHKIKEQFIKRTKI